MDISIIKKVKEYIKEYVKLLYILPTYKNTLKQYKSCSKRKIVLIGTPAHGNLGDHAIAISEIKFIQNFKSNQIAFEIPTPLYKIHRRYLMKYCNHNDLIIISGGGWMGNLWIHNELMIRNIIEDYPMNRIIIFPQTLYYADDDAGHKVAEDSKAVFKNHKNLYLSVRDRNSYMAAQKLLEFEKERLLFCPDMVLYGTLAKRNINKKKNKIALVCMRQDVEKTTNIFGIESILKSKGYFPKQTTTVYNHLIKINDREKLVRKLIDQYSEADFIITDRLHAMIFSLLAGIPCYVLNNGTGKVFGVASYLQSANMPVKMVNNVNDIIQESFTMNGKVYEISDELREYFYRLGSLISVE